MSGTRQDVRPALVLLAVLGCWPWQLALGEGATASASARITLHIAPRTELHWPQDPSAATLCLHRQPAERFQVEVRNSQGELVQSVAGSPGSLCLPIGPGGTSGQGDAVTPGAEVLIVAQ